MSARGNRFLDELATGQVSVERLRGLAGELYRLVRSDRRSFALLAARFSDGAAGELFLGMADGEAQALRLLMDFADELELGEGDLRAHRPHAFTQGYPAFLAQTAMFGSRCAVALALLATVAESGECYRRVADSLCEHYGFSEEAVGHFRFFADTPASVLELADAVVVEGLDAGDDPDDAVRVARTVHAFEGLFWETLAGA